jgi:tRNA (guanine-N7-)-methyltransferase
MSSKNSTNDEIKEPQKRFFRQRAHVNPLSFNNAFEYPSCPREFQEKDMKKLYAFSDEDDEKRSKKVDFLDVGCGFGGLTVGLAPLFPNKNVLGMEIRMKVTEYVRLRIKALRAKHPGQYGNAAVIKTNAMKFLPNYFEKGQISKMFFCFPDPHFKVKKHNRRIINYVLLTEYAYVLRPGGLLYTITDVYDLHKWMGDHCESHPCFVRVSQDEIDADKAVPVVFNNTEEGKKVARNNGKKFLNVFRRIPDDKVPLPSWASS